MSWVHIVAIPKGTIRSRSTLKSSRLIFLILSLLACSLSAVNAIDPSSRTTPHEDKLFALQRSTPYPSHPPSTNTQLLRGDNHEK
eukprot:scaffold22356_cov53-Attheya_sp.AAC.9